MARYDHTENLTTPAERAVALVPHDSNQIRETPKAIFVGTGGNITMRGIEEAADTVWKNIPDGAILPFRPKFIRATGTTAADMLLLY